MKRFVILVALGLVCAGCGQYAGARDAPPAAAAPAAVHSPVGQVTVPGPAGDIPASPPPNAITGGPHKATAAKHTGKANQSRGDASKGSGYQGSARAGKSGSKARSGRSSRP